MHVFNKLSRGLRYRLMKCTEPRSPVDMHFMTEPVLLRCVLLVRMLAIGEGACVCSEIAKDMTSLEMVSMYHVLHRELVI